MQEWLICPQPDAWSWNAKLVMAPSEDLPSTPIIPELLSGAEVEKIFDRSARTLRRWEQRGHLMPVRIGSAKFYRAEEIRQLVAGQMETTIQPRSASRKTSRDEPW